MNYLFKSLEYLNKLVLRLTVAADSIPDSRRLQQRIQNAEIKAEEESNEDMAKRRSRIPTILMNDEDALWYDCNRIISDLQIGFERTKEKLINGKSAKS